MDKSPTIYSLRNKLASPTRSQLSQRIASNNSNGPLSLSAQGTALPILDKTDFSEEQLKNVKTKQEMKDWIRRFKGDQIASNNNKSSSFCICKWMKNCPLTKCCIQCKNGCCTGIKNKFENEDKCLRIPMDLWSWQNVVAAIEDATYSDETGEEYSLKHFASVFWQYRIEGKELVVMNVLQIELLVECWFLNNIEEDFFNEVKMRSKQESEDNWHLSLESQYLMNYVDQLRIHSHVISRYHLSMDIVQLIVLEQQDNGISDDDDNHGANELYEDALNIKYCIDLLRSNINLGPKKYWKLSGHYFNKIDNYLSVLVCTQQIREMYLKCFPQFLSEENDSDETGNKSVDEMFDDEFKAMGMGHNDSMSPYLSSFGTMSNGQRNSGRMQTWTGSSFRTNTNPDNAFHLIQVNLNRNMRQHSRFKSQKTGKLTNRKNYTTDLLDRCTDKCCGGEYICCQDRCDNYVKCVHNTDRIYIKIACIILIAMMMGCFFIIGYYYEHGRDQADDAMFLSLEAIGDRATNIMIEEFWIPQMEISTTIGGLTTGDLLPNATLYGMSGLDHNYKYDQFFASFTKVKHTAAIFSIYMYNPEDNTMLGAYRLPDDDLTDKYYNDTVVIVSYNGTCRNDRLYHDGERQRIPTHDPDKVANYLNCDYAPPSRRWYKKAAKLGVGHSAWTEPYVFSEKYRGMSYVSPIIWNGKNFTFVVEVTTFTLAVAISTEVEQLPSGTLWMIVTPRKNAVASSNNETFIVDYDAEICPECEA